LTGEEVATPLLQSTIGNQQAAMKTWSLRCGLWLRCFCYGATLPDPDKILLGSGKQNRFIRLEKGEMP
jgi:hypothetical protein